MLKKKWLKDAPKREQVIDITAMQDAIWKMPETGGVSEGSPT